MRKFIFFLIAIGVLVYFNSLFNGFVWDDEEQVLNNTVVHSLVNIPQFFSGSTFNTGGAGGLAGMYYKPLMSTSFSLIYSIFGPNAFFFHFFQIGLHIGNAILLFYFLLYFFRPRLSFILSLIFLIHPINTETVDYISALQDVLFFSFGMLSLFFLQRGIEQFKKIFLVGLFLLCSLLSKETGILFMIIALLFTFLFERKYFKKLLLTSFATLGVYGLLRFVVAGIYLHQSGPSPIMRASFYERLLTAPQVVFYYIKTFFLPWNLSISQHWIIRDANFSTFYLPLFLVILFFGLLILKIYYLWKKDKNLKQFFFFFVWLVLGIAFHLQIFPLDMTVAERWFYFSMVGFLGVVGTTLCDIKFRNKSLEKILQTTLVIVLLLLSFRTFARNFDWQNGLDLFSHDEKISQGSFDLENNLGVELFRAQNISDAEIHFKKSTELAPYWWTSWSNLGVIMERKGDYGKAQDYYKKAIENGNYYLAYENLANVLWTHESTQSAAIFTKKALEKLPQNPKLWMILSITNYQLGNTSESLKAAANAFTLSPNQQTYYLYNQLLKGEPIQPK